MKRRLSNISIALSVSLGILFQSGCALTPCDMAATGAGIAGIGAVLPGLKEKERYALGAAAIVMGIVAYNCYRANERQMAEARATALQRKKVYVSKGGASTGQQRYFAKTVNKDTNVNRSHQVPSGTRTRDVIIIDAEKGEVVDPAAYEVDRSQDKINYQNKVVPVIG